MALERFNRLPEDRRQDILEIAARHFAKRGFEGTSYSELLAEIGFGKSQAYYYFENKRDLFVTACRAGYAEFYRQLAERPEPESADGFWNRIVEDTELGFHYQKQHPMAAQLSLAIAQSPSRYALAAEVVVGDQVGREGYDAWLRLGQSLGAVRTDLPQGVARDLALGISALTDAWFAERAEAASEREMREWALLFGNLFERVLAPAGRPSSRADEVQGDGR